MRRFHVSATFTFPALFAAMPKGTESGIGLTVAMQAMSDMDQLQPVEGLGPVGEIRLVPDLDSFAILPYAPKRAVMLADMVRLDHRPWESCPRQIFEADGGTSGRPRSQDPGRL